MNFAFLPNAITLLRLFLVPVLVLLLKYEEYQTALAVFVVAGVSDALDGFIAKRFDLVTHLGAVLDPLADKLLLVSAYIMLTVMGQVPFWLLVAVGFRDLLIVGGYIVVTSVVGSVQMQPSYLSKLNTVTQITLVVAILVQLAAGMRLQGLTDVLIYAVFITTVSSGVHYLWVWAIRKDIQPLAQHDRNGDG